VQDRCFAASGAVAKSENISYSGAWRVSVSTLAVEVEDAHSRAMSGLTPRPRGANEVGTLYRK
jgi:hypothetical protein